MAAVRDFGATGPIGAGDLRKMGQEGVSESSCRVAGGVVDEAEQDEVRFLDGVEGAHPVGRETKGEEGGQFEVPLDHALASRLIAFPAAL